MKTSGPPPGNADSSVAATPQATANPYASIADSESRSPGGRYLLVRLAFAFVVFVASLVIAQSLLFGCAIAVAGYLIPGPFQFSDVMASPVGWWVKVGSCITIPVCLILACFSYGRIAKTQRALLDTVSKRRDLHRQLQELRADFGSKKQKTE